MRLSEVFDDNDILDEYGVGRVIPGVNTTSDVGPNELKKQAKKWGFKVNKDGVPPKAKTNGKLNELTPYKSHEVYVKAKRRFAKPKDYDARQSTFKGFAKLLKTHGFKLLGSGSFGITFEKPGYPWVIKVFTTDNPYKHFIDYVIKHQDNPHLPRIKGQFIKINPHTFAVRIEKLNPIPESHPLVQQLEWIVGDASDEPIRKSVGDWLRKKYPKILKIFQDIRKSTRDLYFTYDTHDANIMLRNDGTPVITDPIYDANSHD